MTTAKPFAGLILFCLALALTLSMGCGDDGGIDASADGGGTDIPSADGNGSDTGVGDSTTGDGANDAPLVDAPPPDGTGSDGVTMDGTGTDGTSADGTSADVPVDVPEPDAGGADECRTDADCRLVSDCCDCRAAPVGVPVAVCRLGCEVQACERNAIPGAKCQGGECVLAGVNCDTSRVECDAPPPACDPGSVAQVSDGCFSGLCVPVTSCESVTDCSACQAGQSCVRRTSLAGPVNSCSRIPDGCGGAPTCACMGDVCRSPFMCSGDGDPLLCSCPTC